jgi:hypothetical protein
MAAKVLHTYAVSPANKLSAVRELLEKLQEAPQHKWIPIEEMSSSKQATLTGRQAGWIANQVERSVEGATIEFSAVPIEEDED